jgi:LPXTG-motif cell wall-anchored protein
MDTKGELLLAYAVELENSTSGTKYSSINTGDTTNILMPIVVMLAALLLLILTVMSVRKDRREERD